MTDHRDLIAEARTRAGLLSADVRAAARDSGDIVTRLTDALEQVTEASDANAYAARTLRQRVHDLAAERDRLAGVIAKVRELLAAPSDERGITWDEWIDDGLGGDFHAHLHAILDAPSDPTPTESEESK